MDEIIEELKRKIAELGPINEEEAKKAREDMDRRIAALPIFDPVEIAKKQEEAITQHKALKIKRATAKCMNSFLLKSSLGLLLFSLLFHFYMVFLFDKNVYFFLFGLFLSVIYVIWGLFQVKIIYSQIKLLIDIKAYKNLW